MASTSTRRKPAPKKAASRSGFAGRLRGSAQRIGGQGPLWAKILRWLVFLAVIGIVAGALLFFILYRAIAIPDPNQDFLTQTTKVYYSDGKSEIGTFANQDRESIPITEIPSSMQAAAIAAEDRSFYDNNGIDFKGIVRALRDNTAAGEIRGGGSTITQQYVKILYLTQERSYTRKVKEAVLSIKIHNQLSKKDILEGYLNTIYFGNGAYGIEVASQTYFDKPASELNYAQSALLATIINSPSYYDPYTEGAEERIMPRFNYVLEGMQKSGAITAEEREKFRERMPKVQERKVSNRLGGTKGYLLSMVQQELRSLGYSDTEINGGGYRITTTFNKARQKAAVDAVKDNKPDKDELNTALVSIQPGTGAVQALYGGPDYVEKPFNWATERTQPGSTFKAFALVAALEDGYGLRTQLDGSSPMKVGGGTVENQGDSGGASFGRVSLERATQKSINTAFVDLTLQMGDDNIEVGAQKVLDAAVEAGIPKAVTDDIGKVAVTSLGYAPVAPIDMANAYATLAAGGERADWFVVEKVEGQKAYQHEVKSERTIDEDVAGDTIKAMQEVVNTGGAGTGSNGRTICPTAGKTGTATFGEDNDQHVSSSWFAGYTPNLATAVMFNRGPNGNADLEGYMQPFFGGSIPASTFRAYMNTALEGTECGSFIKPGNIKADKGTVYVPPPPKCGKDERLNDAKTACVDKPKPKPTPTPTPTPTPPPTTEEPCVDDPLTPGNDCPGAGTGGDRGVLLPLPLLAAGWLGWRRRQSTTTRSNVAVV